jgi:branched-chain amino acid transport system ATP-binding protein
VGEPLLQVAELDCFYGSLQVLFGVSFEVPEAGRVALLGTNGAGKSTLLRAVAGLLEPSGGSVRFDGEDITPLGPHERVARGITLVEGGRATFPSLTVADNLRMGAYPFLRERARVQARWDEVLDLFPQLRPRLEQPAGVCSGGEQQMMAIGRALVAQPRLLMIDELSLGLAPVVMAEIVAAIERVAAAGTTVLLVEQSLNVALSIAGWAYFMEKGAVRFSGPTSELLERGDLARSVFFGADEADRVVSG